MNWQCRRRQFENIVSTVCSRAIVRELSPRGLNASLQVSYTTTALQKPNVLRSASRLRIRKRVNPFGARRRYRRASHENTRKIVQVPNRARVGIPMRSVPSKIPCQERMLHALQASEGGSSTSERRSGSVSCVAGGMPCVWAVLGNQVNSEFTLTLIGQRTCYVVRLENESA